MKRLLGIFCTVIALGFSGIAFAQSPQIQPAILTRKDVIRQMLQAKQAELEKNKAAVERNQAELAELKKEYAAYQKIDVAQAEKDRQAAVAKYLTPFQKNPKTILQIAPPSPISTEYIAKLNEFSWANQKKIIEILEAPNSPVARYNQFVKSKLVLEGDANILVSTCINGLGQPSCSGHLSAIQLKDPFDPTVKFVMYPIFVNNKFDHYDLRKIDIKAPLSNPDNNIDPGMTAPFKNLPNIDPEFGRMPSVPFQGQPIMPTPVPKKSR